MPAVEVRRGANRCAVLVGHWAFKFPNPASWRSLLYGLLNNMNERWAASVAAGSFHCTVITAIPGGFLNIMPRCRPLTDEEWRNFDPASVSGIEVEHKPDSFGVLNGRVVAVDYGIPRERW